MLVSILRIILDKKNASNTFLLTHYIIGSNLLDKN